MFFKAFLALLFIIRLRRIPTHLSDYVRVRYGEQGYKEYRCYENTKRNLTKAGLDKNYLTTCKSYDVIPKFLRFKLYKRCLNSASFCKEWQTKLLIGEIHYKKRAEEKLLLVVSSAEVRIRSTFSWLDASIVFRHVAASTELFKQSTLLVHHAVAYLGGGAGCAPNYVRTGRHIVGGGSRQAFLYIL